MILFDCDNFPFRITVDSSDVIITDFEIDWMCSNAVQCHELYAPDDCYFDPDELNMPDQELDVSYIHYEYDASYMDYGLDVSFTTAFNFGNHLSLKS